MNSCTLIRALFILLALLLCASPLHAQTTFHVDDDAPGDPGPGDPLVSDPLEAGSVDHPFDAIQEAIDASVSGDTILVLDGTYTGTGNRDMNFNGKDIVLQSVNGPADCTIDGQATPGEFHFAFKIINGESEAAVIQGFTITDFSSENESAVFTVNFASPTILDNVIELNQSNWGSGAISVMNSAAKIVNNEIRENWGRYGGAIVVLGNSAPFIYNNLIEYNVSMTWGNDASGAVFCWTNSVDEPCTPFIVNNTITGNGSLTVDAVGGLYAAVLAEPLVRNCIVYGNQSTPDDQIELNGTGSVSYCDVEGGFPGTGNIDADPQFVSGPDGDYYLSQVAAGQATNSPCVNAGSDPGASICLALPDGPWCLNEGATRSDTANDSGQVDMGYHYPTSYTFSQTMNCGPSSGTVPFTLGFHVWLGNLHPTNFRQLAGRINLELANGNTYPNWRAGHLVLAPDEFFESYWNQTIPAISSVIGLNRFTFLVTDVTPAPYNQPPYAPSGGTKFNTCATTAVAP